MKRDLEWLLLHTMPVTGERAAALESWSNVLRAAGFARADVDELLELADGKWRARKEVP